jgi:DNA invertase Pin-like site-specific DNA recombinase
MPAGYPCPPDEHSSAGVRKIVGYIRVSTDKQAEQGLGLDVQRQALRAWARAGGHRLVEVIADEGVSGPDGIEHRAGLAEALATVRAPKADNH